MSLSARLHFPVSLLCLTRIASASCFCSQMLIIVQTYNAQLSALLTTNRLTTPIGGITDLYGQTVGGC